MAKEKDIATGKNIASVLAFEKKLVPSDGYMYGTTWGERSVEASLQLIEKSVRGTISNRLKDVVKNDPTKLNAEMEKPNLQRVDSCALSPEQDTLHLYFTLKVLGGVQKPSACNNSAFQQGYTAAVREYIEREKFEELGRRYALNIANARFLWRNRVGVEQIEVVVSDANSEKCWTFDAKQFSTRTMQCSNADVASLGQAIAAALASEDSFLMLQIDCYAKVGKAQEVYPSEELVLEKENGKAKGKKSKVLYAANGIAAMHSQKVGNALRSIDTWYPEFDNESSSAGPIAIESYGAVTNMGKAFRANKQDFFTFFDKFARGEKLQRLEDEHYVMAMLVRGGVFGESDK